MRALLAATLVTAALAAPASAHPAYHYAGECRYWAVSAAGDEHTGVAYVAVVATDAATGDPAPGVPITVRCELRIDGTAYPAGGASGVGAAAGAAPIRYASPPDDAHRTMCTIVTVGGDPHESCPPPTVIHIPPQHGDVTYWVVQAVDLASCTALVALHRRGVEGVEEDGDLHVNGEPVWDCPPYDEWPYSSGSDE